MTGQIIECVPNISEGRDLSVINKFIGIIEQEEGVRLLHVDAGKSANRTVFTFAGEPESVTDVAYRLVEHANKALDMTHHQGIHPRIGAVDVCPLVPIKNMSMEETMQWAWQLSERIGSGLGIPVYCYENAAVLNARRSLTNIRKGQYEGLEQKMMDPEWAPDFGPAQFNKKFGAIAVGARNLLVAYNINLTTTDVAIAKEIASKIRETGKKEGYKTGFTYRTFSTTLKNVKAIGWYLQEYGFTQVSTNLTNVQITPLHAVYETVKKLAKQYNTEVRGSEIIGLVPLQTMIEAGIFYKKGDKTIPGNEKEVITIAVESMGLNSVSPFEAKDRIIEYTLGLV